MAEQTSTDGEVSEMQDRTHRCGYGTFKVIAAKEISKKNARSLAEALEFKPAEKDGIEHDPNAGLALICKMEEKGLLSESNIEQLVNGMRQINLDGVASKIIEEYSKIQTMKEINIPDNKQDTSQEKTHSFSELLRKLGLERNKPISLHKAMEVKICHERDVGYTGILDNFISKITCYDHRIHQRRLQLPGFDRSHRVPNNNQEPDTKSWTNSDSDESETTDDHSQGNSVSSRDILYAILSCLDPFLLQDVFMKMSACQLAVPVLMPHVFDDCVDFRLWCLRKITKSWYDKESTAIKTENIVNYSLLAVTALKFGVINQSKSNVLNKLLGISQDLDEHAYFDSFEQDPSRSIWSNGTLECAWYFPVNRCQAYNPLKATSLSPKYKFEEALALLNLRGDAKEFNSQMKFAVENSFVTIVFINSDSKKKYKKEIDEIKKTSHVILILCKSPNSNETKRLSHKTKKHAAITIINATELAAVEIADMITETVALLIKDKQQSLKKCCLAESTDMCRKHSIRVDEDVPECKEARKRAEEIMYFLELETYEKDKTFPFQTCWSLLMNEPQHDGPINAERYDNKESATDPDIEHQLAKKDEKEMEVRKTQLHAKLPEPIKKFYKGCSYEKTKMQYFLQWLQMLLNNLSMTTLKPLFAQLKTNSAKIKNLSSKINKLNTKMEHTQSNNEEELHKNLEDYTLLETELITENGQLIDKFEDCVGLEHFMRELSQLFEAYQVSNDITLEQNIKYNSLPSLAASMLLSGLPIEILDGDSKSVPIIWVKEILGSVKEMLGEDSRLYVISVLGIQSSGKSTLMNSLFGVRFAVSAGRCTRGAFLQLVPVAQSLRVVLKCDFIAIVDTEGLRAPEKREVKNSTTRDNELATFALCISDLTLINIGGQTMGEDMTNVLQIAANAFIRMKEVNLNAECRIIQQLVADITAEEQNEAAMQSIISTLNEAIRAAAKKEGKSHLYRQFSDVFFVQNYKKETDNVQYIPSLWRGCMGVPNNQYGVSVQRLKSNILECIQQNNTLGNISEFISRMSDVWNAIGKEDFVFSFQNTREASLYESFMAVYRNSLTPVRRELIGMQAKARQNIENSESEATPTVLRDGLEEIDSHLDKQCENILQEIGKLIKEEKYTSVQKHEVYFKLDLKTKKNRMFENAKAELEQVAEHHRKKKEKSSILNRLRHDLRKGMTTVAEQLRLEIPASEQTGRKNEDIDHFIDKAFEVFWSLSYKKIVDDYPLTTLEEILEQNERSLKTSIISETQNTSLKMDTYTQNPLKFYSVSTNVVFDDYSAVNRFRLTLNSIDPNQTQFEELVRYIEKIAKENLNFQKDASKSVTKLYEFLKSANIEMGHRNIALYICSRFAEVAQSEHCRRESDMIKKYDDTENKIFLLDVVPITRLEQTFCQVVNSFFNLNSETIQNILISGETHKRKRVWFKRIIYPKKSRNSSESWKESLDQNLKIFFEGIEENTKECNCTKENMERFCRYIEEHVKLTDKSVKSQVIAHALGQGIAQFRIYVVDYIDQVVNNAEYRMQFAQPLDFPDLNSKLDEMNKLVITFVNDQQLLNISSTDRRTFHQELYEQAQKYSNLPQSLSVLQLLDANFLRDLPHVSMDDSNAIHKEVNTLKKNLLAQNLASFSTAYMLTQLTGIIYRDYEKAESFTCSNKVKRAIVFHIAAWILPIITVKQHQFEKSKNVAMLINEEKETLHNFFRGFCIKHKEQIVAQAFCNIVKSAIKEGATERVFPILYSSIKKEQIEFSKKRVFIGHVLIDFCQNDNCEGFADFLERFKDVGLSWSLRRIAIACNNRHSLLHKTYQQYIDTAIKEVLNVIKETQATFQSHEPTFSNWLSTFVEKLKTKARLTCKTIDIENLKKFQIVESFSFFTKECNKIISKVAPEIIQSIELPTPDKVDETISWLLETPFNLHVSLFEEIEGCKEQCPFCGAVCDKDMSAHEKHSAALHYPQGINGWCYLSTKKLITGICTSLVDSNCEYKTKSSNNDKPEYRPYRDYEIDFPDWYIRGASKSDKSEPTEFWKFVFAQLNEKLAERHNCEKGDVPQAWNKITIDNAIQSAKKMYCNTFCFGNMVKYPFGK